jgi:hypothetical protein
MTTTSSVPRNANVYVDLRSAKPVAFVRYSFARSDLADAVKIEISTNKRDWQTVATLSNPPAGEWQEVSVGTSTRYVRFSFTNPNKDPKIGGLAEVEVWG